MIAFNDLNDQYYSYDNSYYGRKQHIMIIIIIMVMINS